MPVTGRRLLVLALLVAAIADPGVAGAAFPGSPGRLAMNVGTDAGIDIFTARRDGTDIRRLTSDGRSLNPRWSADGNRIAFNRGGDVFVMGAGGGNVRRVTTTGRSFQPTWSPDGTRLAFVRVPVGTPGDIWTVPVAGGAATRLTFDGATACGHSHPVWSPDGARIAFERQVKGPDGTCSTDAPPRVVILTLATNARRTITDAASPDFTADGRGIVFDGRADHLGQCCNGPNLIWSALDGSGRAFLTTFLCAEGENCYSEGAAGPTSAYPTRPHVLSVNTNSFIDPQGEERARACVVTVAAVTQAFCTHRVPGWEGKFPGNIDWQPRP